MLDIRISMFAFKHKPEATVGRLDAKDHIRLSHICGCWSPLLSLKQYGKLTDSLTICDNMVAY